MQLTWVLYIVALSILAGVAALWTSRLLRHFDRPTRWIWLGALLLSTVLPLAALLFPRTVDRLTFGAAALVGGHQGGLHDWMGELRRLQWYWTLDLPDIRDLLRVTWGVALAGAGLWLAHGIWALRRRRRLWTEDVVDGRRCLISRETGPAIVGLLNLRMVLPQWVLDLSRPQRALVLRHEEEHLERRDPWLLAVAYGALLSFPWNPVLWWQVRRLRLAIELDCDRRVAEQHQDRGGYSELLLRVARGGRPAPAPALARGESHAGERIRELISPDRVGGARLAARSVGALLLAGLLFVTPRPILLHQDDSPPESLSRVDPTPYEEPPECLNCETVARRVKELVGERGYAPTGRGPRSGDGDAAVSGLAVLVTEEGLVRHTVFGPDQETDSPEVNHILRTAARSLRWRPARLRGEAVPAWIYHRFPLP